MLALRISIQVSSPSSRTSNGIGFSSSFFSPLDLTMAHAWSFEEPASLEPLDLTHMTWPWLPEESPRDRLRNRVASSSTFEVWVILEFLEKAGMILSRGKLNGENLQWYDKVVLVLTWTQIDMESVIYIDNCFCNLIQAKSLYEQWLRMPDLLLALSTIPHESVLVYWIMVCHPKQINQSNFRRSHVNGQESRNNRVHKSFTKNTLVDLTWFDLIENNCDLNDTEQPVTAAQHHQGPQLSNNSSTTILLQYHCNKARVNNNLHTGFYSKAVQQNTVSHGQASL